MGFELESVSEIDHLMLTLGCHFNVLTLTITNIRKCAMFEKYGEVSNWLRDLAPNYHPNQYLIIIDETESSENLM